MSEDSLMPVHPLAWVLSSVTSGELGDSSLIGNKRVKTSDGPKPLLWNFSSDLFSNLAPPPDTNSIVTTLGLSKGGGLAGAITLRPTEFSKEFTTCWKDIDLLSLPDMSTQSITPQMVPQEESSLHTTSSFHHSQSCLTSDMSSLTLTHQSNMVNKMLLEVFLLSQNKFYPLANGSDECKQTVSLMSSPTPQHKIPHLVSVLSRSPLPCEFLFHHHFSLQGAHPWTVPTLMLPTPETIAGVPELESSLLQPEPCPASWGTTLMKKTCKPQQARPGKNHFKNIHEDHQALVELMGLSSFITSLVGTYGGSTIWNYVYGVWAWHIIHGAKWKINSKEINALFKSGNKSALKEMRKKTKQPWTLKYLTKSVRTLTTPNQRMPQFSCVLPLPSGVQLDWAKSLCTISRLSTLPFMSKCLMLGAMCWTETTSHPQSSTFPTPK